ncbi:acyltransferase domain-containing protein [Streptomyces sp. GD-15H]
MLSLADACTLVAARGRLTDALPPGGATAAVAIGADEMAAHLAETGRAAESAAVNSPTSVVVSGDKAAVREAAAYFRDRGRSTTPPRVGHAFHSARMEPVPADFAEVVRRCRSARGQAGPNFTLHRRIVSYETVTPRVSSNSSTSR